MFRQFCKKIIALVSALCLSISFLVVPASAADDVELTEDFLEYFALLADGGVSPLSDTSDAVITMSDPICDSTIAVHASCSMSGAGSPDTYYRFLVLLMEKDTSSIIHQQYSDTFTATVQGYTWSYAYLEPETDYSVGFFLVDGSTIVSSVGVAKSFTTPVQGEAVSNIFLSSIYGQLVSLENNQSNMISLLTSIGVLQIRTNTLLGNLIDATTAFEDSVINSLSMMYPKLYQIAANTGELVNLLAPSDSEAALKEVTADVTTAYTESFWSSDGSGFGREDISTSAEVLSGTKEMFNTGVSVADFFGLFGTYGWGNWFSAETAADLDTTTKSSAVLSADDDALTTYEENLQEIQNFGGGS